jgi:Protein of unknown function (DUF2612)
MSSSPVQALNAGYYTDLLTSEYRPFYAPQFNQWLLAALYIAQDISNCLQSMSSAFDLNYAIGAQLDILGQIVGVGRVVPFQPSDGVSPVLDDATYRTLIRATIANNHWDGLIGSLYPIWAQLFPGGNITIIDNQNMTATILITGTFTSILQDLIVNGFIIPRPQAVLYNYVFGGLPFFGFDTNDAFIAGFDTGKWS